MSETENCTTGIGPSTNNCHGIRNGNTAPCDRVTAGRFCIYESTEESYEAFKLIWSTWYKVLPGEYEASRWSGNSPVWLENVLYYYNQ